MGFEDDNREDDELTPPSLPLPPRKQDAVPLVPHDLEEK